MATTGSNANTMNETNPDRPMRWIDFNTYIHTWVGSLTAITNWPIAADFCTLPLFLSFFHSFFFLSA